MRHVWQNYVKAQGFVDVAQVFFLLGSNIGDRLAWLASARQRLEACIAPIALRSKVYESEPWGDAKQPHFLNQAVSIFTSSDPFEVLRTCLEIEAKLERVRGRFYAPRTIDIDLLYYGQRVIDHEILKIPHPSISDRRFTLLPMTEVAPTWKHPVLHKSQRELLEACPDPLQVCPYEADCH